MKKVIYVNYMKQFGHINFDQIHIHALLEQGFDVKVVMHYDIANKMNLSKELYALTLPAFLGYECKSGMINRLLYVMTLIYIKLHVNFSKYDYCIISNLDEISLSIVPLAKKMYMFCHGNCRDLENYIKFFFLKHLSKHHEFIVFSDEMQKPFKDKGFCNIHVISHGCIPPFTERVMSHDFCNMLNKFDFVVFHPSPKSDINFLKTIYTKEYNNILNRNNILLLLRNSPFEDKGYSNIRFINTYLKENDYQVLFKRANIILLAYPNNFKYQVSGVSYECVANNKKMLVLKNPSLNYCIYFYNYDIFFENANDVIRHIIKMKNHSKDYKCTASPKDLSPNYSIILD